MDTLHIQRPRSSGNMKAAAPKLELTVDHPDLDATQPVRRPQRRSKSRFGDTTLRIVQPLPATPPEKADAQTSAAEGGARPAPGNMALNKLLVTVYKFAGFGILTIILFGLASYLATEIFYLGCTARHSATLMWDAESTDESTYTWVLAINANNHGRAYNGSYMSYDCYSNGGWFYNATISGSTATGATGAYDGLGGCQTAYSWSGSNNQHLCNDDAAYELWQAKDGSMNTRFGGNLNFNWSSSQGASGWGSSFSGVSAFACNYPSGDYNTPNCP